MKYKNNNAGWRPYLWLALVCVSSMTQAQYKAVVTTAEVTEMPVMASIELMGTLKANQQVAIAPQVSARVTQVHFESGQLVKKGQVLLSLDNRAAKAQVREAQASLMDAQRIFKNYNTLFSRKAVTQTELDGQQAAVAMAEAKLAAAQVQASYLTLHAPFSGVMGLTDVAPGALLAANEPVADLLDISQLKLDVALPEKYFNKVKVGETLTAYSDAYGEQAFNGKLAVMAPSVNSDSLNATVRLVFDNSMPENSQPDNAKPDKTHNTLVPGMLMRVALTVDNSVQLAIPVQSLLYAGQQRYVYVVDAENKVSRRDVTIGRNMGEQVTVVDGLKAGERVISAGTVKVRVGSVVEVLDEAL
ncbi:efflux transporter periplasmic adaptor subunit [Oceanisphaera profunda]|uniref:Efflux transporter periplasmic adaptor subunit n=1 Tax=Oceanisphaera profunda TaxID=1416627 RepID=A0A1Y0D2I8_9GAMM|nr:efflux RND transporter periplasmic adaptor subunit [Oceanisphaera profunda]ART81742.1 efflux transporter periplasmic adaptor subunit [Oceanisphaera profunda]